MELFYWELLIKKKYTFCSIVSYDTTYIQSLKDIVGKLCKSVTPHAGSPTACWEPFIDWTVSRNAPRFFFLCRGNKLVHFKRDAGIKYLSSKDSHRQAQGTQKETEWSYLSSKL